MTSPVRILARAEHQIHDNIERMATLAGNALESALAALKSQDAELAEQVIDQDGRINALMNLVEQECLTVLATLEPKARDLRETVASM